MKKKVRIYKSPNNKGEYLNKTKKFLSKFQNGGALTEHRLLDAYAENVFSQLNANMKPEDIYENLLVSGLDKEMAGSIMTNVITKMIQAGLFDPQYFENQFSGNMDYVTTFPDASKVREKIYTDYCVQDASYISLRSVNLGYTLPSAIAKRIGMAKLRVYASGQNLMYLMSKGYTSFNPEGITDFTSPLRGGYQVGAAPIVKSFTAGINLEF